MTKTKIEWATDTWNPVRGCSRVSEGCRNCYAERMAARFSGPGQPFEVFAEPVGRTSRGGSRWTGRVELIPEKLAEPLHWRKPRRVFVNSMSDLFHEALSDGHIIRVFSVMQRAAQHTFLVLTKRAARMPDVVARIMAPEPPLPNVWLGVSCEDQETADERIPLLLQTPAAHRFVSLEPLLGPIKFCDCDQYWPGEGHPPDCPTQRLDGVIVGGESGPGARPCDVDWIRAIVRQCREAGVACFLKQVGRWVLGDSEGFAVDRWLCVDSAGQQYMFVPPILGANAWKRPESAIGFSLADPKGGNPLEWPEDLRVREMPW